MADQIKTQDDDLVIKNEYANPNDASQYATSPNTTAEAANSNTGSGTSAPEINLGVDENGNPIKEQLKYSWESKAEDRAGLSYESDVLTAKSNMLENRQNIESQGQQLQDQVAMDKYSKNQSVEKAGWTGGYVLDTERQMNYLKQTIQSQMYGQMELQKYGYNTSLAAARLAYDTNRYDLALEYYNTALSRAVSEAEITGYYVSPEASEMLDQYSMASRTMNDETASEEDKQRADKVLAAVYEWFEANGISRNGVETYKHLVEERTYKQSVNSLYEWTNDSKNQISTDTFADLDTNGNKQYNDDGTIKTIDFSKMSATELKDYITNPDGSINETKRDQYYSRLDSLSYEMENNFTSWCKKQGYVDSEGNTNIDDFKEAFIEFLQSDNLVDKLAKELNRLGDDNKEFIENLADNWDCDLKLPDGTEYTIKLVRSGTGMGGTKETDENGVEKTKTSTVNSNTTTIKFPDGSQIEANYMKTQKSADAVMKLLKSNNYSDVYNAIANINIEDYKDIDSLLGQILGIGAEGFGAVAGVAVNTGFLWTGIASAISTTASATGIGALVAVGVDTYVTWFKDMFKSGDWKKKREAMEIVTTGLEQSIGKDNINLLKSAYEEYNKMDQYTKNGLSDSKRQMYEDASKFYKNYAGILQAIDYCSHYDSNLFDSGLFEYTGDMFSRIGDRWDNGYQFGDVMGTVIDTGKAVLTGLEEVGLAIIGKGWLW